MPSFCCIASRLTKACTAPARPNPRTSGHRVSQNMKKPVRKLRPMSLIQPMLARITNAPGGRWPGRPPPASPSTRRRRGERSRPRSGPDVRRGAPTPPIAMPSWPQTPAPGRRCSSGPRHHPLQPTHLALHPAKPLLDGLLVVGVAEWHRSPPDLYPLQVYSTEKATNQVSRMLRSWWRRARG